MSKKAPPKAGVHQRLTWNHRRSTSHSRSASTVPPAVPEHALATVEELLRAARS
jgi:hypothetical protein